MQATMNPLRINRDQFAAIERLHGWGGDYWNPTKVIHAVLRRVPDVSAIEYTISSGLYADVAVYAPSGDRKIRI